MPIGAGTVLTAKGRNYWPGDYGNTLLTCSKRRREAPSARPKTQPSAFSTTISPHRVVPALLCPARSKCRHTFRLQFEYREIRLPQVGALGWACTRPPAIRYDWRVLPFKPLIVWGQRLLKK